MAESFLVEQLERIRKLSERMSQVRNETDELADLIAHEREVMRQSPLHEVRDYRTYPTEHSLRDQAPDSTRRSTARNTSRRRRRR